MWNPPIRGRTQVRLPVSAHLSLIFVCDFRTLSRDFALLHNNYYWNINRAHISQGRSGGTSSSQPIPDVSSIQQVLLRERDIYIYKYTDTRAVLDETKIGNVLQQHSWSASKTHIPWKLRQWPITHAVPMPAFVCFWHTCCSRKVSGYTCSANACFRLFLTHLL